MANLRRPPGHDQKSSCIREAFREGQETAHNLWRARHPGKLLWRHANLPVDLIIYGFQDPGAFWNGFPMDTEDPVALWVCLVALRSGHRGALGSNFHCRSCFLEQPGMAQSTANLFLQGWAALWSCTASLQEEASVRSCGSSFLEQLLAPSWWRGGAGRGMWGWPASPLPSYHLPGAFAPFAPPQVHHCCKAVRLTGSVGSQVLNPNKGVLATSWQAVKSGLGYPHVFKHSKPKDC